MSRVLLASQQQRPPGVASRGDGLGSAARHAALSEPEADDGDYAMEYDDDDMTQSESPDLSVHGAETHGGCRAVPPDKKNRTGQHFRVRSL